MTPLFRLEAVGLVVDGSPILDRIDLKIEDGGVTCVVGPSGAGKTSLLRLLNRLDVPTTGTIALRGTPLDSLDPLLLRRQVAMVFQRPPVFPGSVLDNLRIAAPDLTPGEVASALARVDLEADTADQEADALSGGEAQRMCLARALLTDPEVLLADEPTSSLDQEATRTLERVLAGMAGNGLTVILVSHDLAQMERMADRVVVLDHGRLVAHDRLASVRHNDDPAVTRAIRAIP